MVLLFLKIFVPFNTIVTTHDRNIHSAYHVECNHFLSFHLFFGMAVDKNVTISKFPLSCTVIAKD